MSYSVVKDWNLFRPGTRQRCLVLPRLFNMILKVLARAIRKEKRNERHQIVLGEEKLSLLSDGMILYVENPKESKNTH